MFRHCAWMSTGTAVWVHHRSARRWGEPPPFGRRERARVRRVPGAARLRALRHVRVEVAGGLQPGGPGYGEDNRISNPRGKGEESSIRRRCRPGSGARRRAVRGRHRRRQHAAPAQRRDLRGHPRAHARASSAWPMRTAATAPRPHPATRPRSPMSSADSRAPATRPSGTRSTSRPGSRTPRPTIAARGCRRRMSEAAPTIVVVRFSGSGNVTAPLIATNDIQIPPPGGARNGDERLRARGLARRRPAAGRTDRAGPARHLPVHAEDPAGRRTWAPPAC